MFSQAQAWARPALSLRTVFAEHTLQGVKTWGAGILLVLTACSGAPAAPRKPPLFASLPPESTGIAFANRLPEDTSFNIMKYLYYYNGGGVAAGDVDGDGLPDLYFTANLGPNHLYKNLGNFHFTDITAAAGVADSIGWKTGVTMADVNGDGRLDIYVSGVDYGTQALFFDYDGDGDLDMYMLNHSTHTERAIAPSTSRLVRNDKAGDRLYRNDGNHFTDVSAAAGSY